MEAIQLEEIGRLLTWTGMAFVYGYLVLAVIWMTFSWWWKSLNLWFATITTFVVIQVVFHVLAMRFGDLLVPQSGFILGFLLFAIVNRNRLLPWRKKEGILNN